MRIISDVTPLVSLAKIGQFHLLEKLFGRLVITSEVYAEVVVAGAGLPGAEETSKAAWIEVQPIKNPASLLLAQTRFGLDLGELSTLVLGKETGADLLLLDDLAARELREGKVFECRVRWEFWKAAIPENTLQICVKPTPGFWRKGFNLIGRFSIQD